VDDVDAVGVPLAKLGLRKKLLALYKFPRQDQPDQSGGQSGEDEGRSESGSRNEEEEVKKERRPCR
jgi:hypothetical protein